MWQASKTRHRRPVWGLVILILPASLVGYFALQHRRELDARQQAIGIAWRYEDAIHSLRKLVEQQDHPVTAPAEPGDRVLSSPVVVAAFKSEAQVLNPCGKDELLCHQIATPFLTINFEYAVVLFLSDEETGLECGVVGSPIKGGVPIQAVKALLVDLRRNSVLAAARFNEPCAKSDPTVSDQVSSWIARFSPK